MREIEKDLSCAAIRLTGVKTGMDKELIRVENLKKYYDIKGGIITHTVSQIQAVDGIDFSIKKGETLGLVGESGCGKTTLGRTILQLHDPSSGKIVYDGETIFEGENPWVTEADGTLKIRSKYQSQSR